MSKNTLAKIIVPGQLIGTTTFYTVISFLGLTDNVISKELPNMNLEISNEET